MAYTEHLKKAWIRAQAILASVYADNKNFFDTSPCQADNVQACFFYMEMSAPEDKEGLSTRLYHVRDLTTRMSEAAALDMFGPELFEKIQVEEIA